MRSVREQPDLAAVVAPSGAREGALWPAIAAALLLTDMAMLACGAAIAYLIRFKAGPIRVLWLEIGRSNEHHFHFYAMATVCYIAVTVTLLLWSGAYQRLRLFQGMAEYTLVVQATGLAALLAEFASYLTNRHETIARGWLLLVWLVGACAAGAGRLGFRHAVRLLHRGALLVQPALVVGAGSEGQMLEWHAYRGRTDGVRVLGFVDDQVPVGTALAGPQCVLGGIDDLPALIAAHRIELVLVATADLRHGDALRVLEHVLPTNAEVALAPDLFRTLTTDGQLRRLAGDTLFVVGKVRIAGFDALLKGLLDLLGAALLLLLTAPLWLVVAALVKATSPGPALTRHPAVGKGGQRFDALKFRTTRMVPVPIEHPDLAQRRLRGLPLRAHPDLTPLGRVLSRYSLDELPQLLNVLRRQMSLVGPYKISPDQLNLYGEHRLAMLTMRPGLTGMCQIHGRGELTVEERSLLDAEYVRTYSIWHDLHLLLATVPAVIRGRGAY